MGAAELGFSAEAMAERDSEGISTVALSPIGGCSSLFGRREEIDDLYIPESNSGKVMAYPELTRSSSQFSSFHCQDTREDLKLARENPSPLSISSLEGKQIGRRSGKMANSSSGSSKRSRIGQMEDLSLNEAEGNDTKVKSPMAKTKNGLNGKRIDRRNGKVPMTSKYDFFSLKTGVVSFNSGGGGNNSLGIFGLKPEAYDITKHLEEMTVKELLDGHYKGPSLAKDNGKKAANLNGNILNSVRKACSILQRKKPVKVQSASENDETYNYNVCAAPVSVDGSKNVKEKGDTAITDLLSHGKVPPKVLDLLLCQPKDILERVGLLPPVDLDTLLVDAARPVNFPKDTLDSRGKQISQRASLAYADAIKVSTNRSMCHGKWARIDNTAALFEGRTGFLNGFECLNYDPKLVPVKSTKYLYSVNHASPAASVSFPFTDVCSSSSAPCWRASQLSPEYGGNVKYEEDAGDSPRSLAAAQTLCNIVKQFPKQEQHQRMTWTSKPLDKTIKGCRSKPGYKLGEIVAKPESVVSSHDFLKITETTSIFKKPRLLNNEKGKDLSARTKGLVNWSMPRSSTQSPSRLYKDTCANIKNYNSFMMPPPTSKIFDKACNNRQRLR